MVEKAIAEGLPFALAFVDGRMPPGLDGVEINVGAPADRLQIADEGFRQRHKEEIGACTHYARQG